MNFKIVVFLVDILIKFFHVKVGFFADDEEGDSVVGVEVVEIENVGCHMFEDEHDVVAAVEVGLLVFGCGCSDSFLALDLLHHLSHVALVHQLGSGFAWFVALAFFEGMFSLFGVDHVVVQFEVAFIEVLVVADS